MPDLDQVINHYSPKGVTPREFNRLEEQLEAAMPLIDKIEKDYLNAHPEATPLMRNSKRHPVLFFQRESHTRRILKLLVCDRQRMEKECDRAFPPDPRNDEVAIEADPAGRQTRSRRPMCALPARHCGLCPLLEDFAGRLTHLQPLRVV